MLGESIDYKKMYENEKQKSMFKLNKIKDFSLYNFLNDGRNNKIIDFREAQEELIKEEKGTIRNDVILISDIQYCLKVRNSTSIKIDRKDHVTVMNLLEGKGDYRLIIISDKDNLIESESFSLLKDFISICNFTIIKYYVINKEDYKTFLDYYSFFLVSSLSSKEDALIAETKFPLQVLDGILYVGGFMNSRNLKQLKLLGIKAIIGLTDVDSELQKKFDTGVVSFYPVNEINKEEIDFNSVYKQFQLEVDENCYPILLYCFSGLTISIAMAIFILMKYKKLNLMAATAVMMKVYPDFKLPTWLYSQLQRVKV